jgi:antitoxin component of MazEF toxin-antitoxin module
MEEFHKWKLAWLEGSILGYLKGDIPSQQLIGRVDKAINDYKMDKREILELIKKIVESPAYLPNMSKEEKRKRVEVLIKSTALSNNYITTKIGSYSGIKRGVGVRVPPSILKGVGLKQGDKARIQVDLSGRIIIGRGIEGMYYERKIRKGGVIRIPNELARRLGLLDEETEAKVWVEEEKIIVDMIK